MANVSFWYRVWYRDCKRKRLMNKILLIWDDKYSLKVYLLHVDKEKFEKIKKCNKRYINANENDELLWLSEWLCDKGIDLIFESGEKGPQDFPVISDSTLVVCGFAE